MGLFLTMLAHRAQGFNEEAAVELSFCAQRAMLDEVYGLIFPGVSHLEIGLSDPWLHQSRGSAGPRG